MVKVDRVMEELKKVTWPNMLQVKNATLLVLFFSVALAIYLGGFEFVFNKLINFIKQAS